MANVSPRVAKTVASACLVVAAALIVAHFVLDAGRGREAPPGLLFFALGFAVAGVFAGSATRMNRRP